MEKHKPQAKTSHACAPQSLQGKDIPTDKTQPQAGSKTNLSAKGKSILLECLLDEFKSQR